MYFANLFRKNRPPDRDPTLETIDLPIDLGRYIIELAARHDPRTARQLLLVSRQVHEWVKPVLFSCISAPNERASFKAMRIALEQNTLENLQAHVHAFGIHLAFEDGGDEPARLLQTCLNIRHLAIWVDWDIHLVPLKSHVQSLRPWTVALPLTPIFGPQPDFGHPFFEGVTHLVVYDAPPFWTKWALLHVMPSLTHLAFRFRPYNPSAFAFLRVLLERCTKLERLIIFTGRGPDVEAAAASFDKELLGDARLLLMPIPNEHRDWEDFVTGGTSNIWANAERNVANRSLSVSPPTA